MLGAPLAVRHYPYDRLCPLDESLTKPDLLFCFSMDIVSYYDVALTGARRSRASGGGHIQLDRSKGFFEHLNRQYFIQESYHTYASL